jgi:hypothetical protein
MASRSSFFPVVLGVACIGLAGLVFVLARQNRQLKAELTAVAEAMRRSENALKAGHRLGPVTGVDAAGAEFALALDGPGRRLLLVASKQCGACAAVRPAWRALGEGAAAASLPALCLYTDGPPEDDAGAELLMPVLGVRGFRQSPLAMLPTVPAVLLVRDGVVEKLWPGPYDGAAKDEILAALGG